MKNNNKKLYSYFIIAISAMAILILLILIIGLIFGRKISYEAIENKINIVALNYALDRKDLLPVLGEEKIIEYQSLVDAEKIKPISNLIKNDTVSCDVKIKIKNNNENYIVFTNLNCSDGYKTKTIKDAILNNNVIKESSDGLYKIGNEYVFRGEKVNNYLKFNNKVWRIIKITSTGDIRMIETKRDDSFVWDDRYNQDVSYESGINDFKVSRIKDSIEEIYNNDFNSNMKKYIAKQNVCIGKRQNNSTDNSGNIECSETIPNMYISLLQANEFALASVDKNCIALNNHTCSNYNYLTSLKKAFWTITGDADKSSKVYKVASTLINSNASGYSAIRVVIHLDGNSSILSGDGTEKNPYIIKTA